MNVLQNIDITKTKVAKRYNPKRSLRARKVAQDIIDNLGKDVQRTEGEIVRANGYAESVARNPQMVKETASYKEVMGPYIQSLQSLRQKTIAALHSKDLDNAKMFDLTMLLKQTDHSLALAQGKSTENIAHKQEIVVFGSDDFLSRQLQNGSARPLP